MTRPGIEPRSPEPLTITLLIRPMACKGISPKVNIIAWLRFELAYYDVAVQPVRHYVMEIPLNFDYERWKQQNCVENNKIALNVEFCKKLSIIKKKFIRL